MDSPPATSIEDEVNIPKRSCASLNDDTSLWKNGFKAWYIFGLHIIACVAFIVTAILWVDGHDFLTGSRTTFSPLQRSFYQTEINALISLSMVLIRSLATTCSTLLVWRLIEVLLDTIGLFLKQLLRMANHRIPIGLRLGSGRRFFWSFSAILVILFQWPGIFVAPLATSAFAWIPSTRPAAPSRQINIRGIGNVGPEKADDAFSNFTLWTEDRWRPIMLSTLGATIDNGYAFTNDSLPVRRLFRAADPIPLGSAIDLTVPFIDVKLKWIDGGPHDQGRFRWLGNPKFITASGIEITDTGVGGVSFYRDTEFDPSKSRPRNATVFQGTKYVLVKTARLFRGRPMPDGTSVRESTPCPSEDPQLGQLPNVQTADYSVGANETTFAFRECFHVAEAEIRAGVRRLSDCNVTYSSDVQNIATCHLKNSTTAIEKDLLVDLALDVMSEVIRNLRPLRTTSMYMKQGIDAYTVGMLRLAYHSAWSSLTDDLGRLTDEQGRPTESVSVKFAEGVVQASVAKTRLYIWLAAHLMLDLAAVIMFILLRCVDRKPTRDPTLTALTMNISDVSHDERAPELCSSVCLVEKDEKMPRLEWSVQSGTDDEESLTTRDECIRRIRFCRPET